MGRHLSPRYGQVILVSGYPVLTAVNWWQHWCAVSFLLGRFPFSQNFRFVIPENFQFKWKGFFPPRNRASFWVLHLTFHWLIADEGQQNKMDDKVAVPLICDFLVNCDEEIERFLRNENDFDFVAIAGVSCCFVRRNLTRIQNYFESTVSNYFGDEFAAHFRMTRTTAELLTREVINTGRIPLGNPFGRPSIPPEKQVLVFLWALATQESTREIADRFDITYSSVSRTVVRVTEAVCGLKNQYIRWPNDE